MSLLTKLPPLSVSMALGAPYCEKRDRRDDVCDGGDLEVRYRDRDAVLAEVVLHRENVAISVRGSW